MGLRLWYRIKISITINNNEICSFFPWITSGDKINDRIKDRNVPQAKSTRHIFGPGIASFTGLSPFRPVNTCIPASVPAFIWPAPWFIVFTACFLYAVWDSTLIIPEHHRREGHVRPREWRLCHELMLPVRSVRSPCYGNVVLGALYSWGMSHIVIWRDIIFVLISFISAYLYYFYKFINYCFPIDKLTTILFLIRI